MSLDDNQIRRRTFLGATGALAGLATTGAALGAATEGHPIPGRIQAEAFDGYDATYIEEGSNADDTATGGWMWTTGTLTYTVDVTPGVYDVSIRAGSWRNDGGVDLAVGATSLGDFRVAASDERHDWQTETLRGVEVTADGETTLDVHFLGRSTTLDWIEFTESDGSHLGYGMGGYDASGYGA